MSKLTQKLFITFICCLSVLSTYASSSKKLQSEGMTLKLDRIVDDLGVVWGMSFISHKQLLVTEREGSAKIIDIESGRITRLKNTPEVLAQGQGGLMDVALSPDYKNTGWIYFTYVKDTDIDNEGTTVLARTKLSGDTFENWQELLITNALTDESYHFGSRIVFDTDGHLFFSVGDRGVRKNAQDLKNHAGSILRLNLDGSIPPDNPYSTDKRLLPEVWSYGHRNPQGMAYDVDNERLWVIEHGPRGGDEINLIKKGANYGWPVISYGKEYWGPIAVGEGTHREGMEQPVKIYTPSIAPGSLLLYSDDRLSAWKGNLLAGSLKLQHLNRIEISQAGEVIKEERLLEDLDERIRALAQSPDGWLYFSTDSGNVYRLSLIE